MTKRGGFSIRSKLLIVLLFSLILAALIFYLVFEFGSFLVWRYYLGASDKQERAEEYVGEFQDYVTKNKLTTDDAELIGAWNAGRYVDLIVYKDSNLIYAPEWFEDFREDDTETEASSVDNTEAETDEGESETHTPGESESGSEVITDKSFYEKWFLGDRGFEQYLTEEARKDYRAALEDALGDDGVLHPVYFVDGTLIVAVVDFTDEVFENVVFAVSALSALVVVALIMILYLGGITKRIRLLQKNVRIIEEGDLEHKIEQSGRDEISLLARDVGSMRDAIVDNMTRERRAWEANAGLITAMSHDIRTPLTVLLGYLDLIEMQNDGNISDEYISACRENALRLKNLSDDMFSYFLVFGKSENELRMIDINARELALHIVSEYALLLSERGYKLDSLGEIPDVCVKIDERYFRRVIDNVFSNIIKYADQKHPVCLGVELCDGRLVLYCKNKTRTDKDIPESNGIGLKTCTKMMEEMGGELLYGECEGVFTAKMILPAEKMDDNSSS